MTRRNVQAQAVRASATTCWIPGRYCFVRLEIDGDRTIFVFQVRIEPTAFRVDRVAFRVSGIGEFRLLHQRGRVEDPNALFTWRGYPHFPGWCDEGNTVRPR